MQDLHEIYQEAEKLKDEGKNEEAIARLLELLDQDETFSLAHLALAMVYGKVNQHENAIRHVQRACELEPNDPFNFTAMSVTYQRASQATDDVADSQRYVRLAEESMAKAQTMDRPSST
jgi:tetratricopeptide (TPR) repeat protein